MEAIMKRSLLIAMLGLALGPAAALADTIEGNVVSVDPATQTVQVAKDDGQTATVTVKSDAEYKNIGSLAEIQPGDKVKIGAKDKDGMLEADKVERTEQAAATGAATAATGAESGTSAPEAGASPSPAAPQY
jgi:hypothetical protein